MLGIRAVVGVMGVIAAGNLMAQEPVPSAPVQADAAKKAATTPPPIRVIPSTPPPQTFDPPEELPADPEPLGDKDAWITANDYPLRAKRAGTEGRTAFELAINQHGRVYSCLVTETSGNSELDSATCRLVRARARFRPAFDADGNPVPGKYNEAVRWTLRAFPTPEVYGAAFAFTVTEDGSVVDCEVNGMIGTVPKGLLERNPCTRVRKFEPFRDAQGNPVRKRVTTSYAQDVVDLPATDGN